MTACVSTNNNACMGQPKKPCMPELIHQHGEARNDCLCVTRNSCSSHRVQRTLRSFFSTTASDDVRRPSTHNAKGKNAIAIPPKHPQAKPACSLQSERLCSNACTASTLPVRKRMENKYAMTTSRHIDASSAGLCLSNMS